jgi:hypothetical protein
MRSSSSGRFDCLFCKSAGVTVTIAWMARREGQLERAPVDRLYMRRLTTARRPTAFRARAGAHPDADWRELGALPLPTRLGFRARLDPRGSGKEPHPN